MKNLQQKNFLIWQHPVATQWLDQGWGAGEEYKTMAEEGMQECPVLAAAHSSVMESDGCRNSLVGAGLKEFYSKGTQQI